MRQARGPGAWFCQLGPGLVTGAADDDPSGIVTYSQAGAAFGYALGWSVVVTLPFMVAVQEISARLGRVTGGGLGLILRRHAPRPVVRVLVLALVIANVINLGADIDAMAATARLLIGGSTTLLALAFALACAGAEIWLAYQRYVRLLKWPPPRCWPTSRCCSSCGSPGPRRWPARCSPACRMAATRW